MEAKIIEKKSKSDWDIKVQYLSWNNKWKDKATFRWWHNALRCVNHITLKEDRILINTTRLTKSELTEIKVTIKRLI